jgi:hypothetical protein
MNGATTTTGAPTTTTTARPTTTNPPTVGDFTIELVSISEPTTIPKRSAFVGIHVPRPKNNNWHLWGNIGYRADINIPNFIPKQGYAFYDGQTNLPITNLSLPKSIPLGNSALYYQPETVPFSFEIPVDDSFVQSLPRTIYIGAGTSGTLRSNTIKIPTLTTTTVAPTTTTTTARPTTTSPPRTLPPLPPLPPATTVPPNATSFAAWTSNQGYIIHTSVAVRPWSVSAPNRWFNLYNATTHQEVFRLGEAYSISEREICIKGNCVFVTDSARILQQGAYVVVRERLPEGIQTWKSNIFNIGG